LILRKGLRWDPPGPFLASCRERLHDEVFTGHVRKLSRWPHVIKYTLSAEDIVPEKKRQGERASTRESPERESERKSDRKSHRQIWSERESKIERERESERERERERIPSHAERAQHP